MTHSRLLDSLRERIVAALPCPLTEVGASALEAYLDLPTIENWCPKNIYLGELSSVFDVGLPLSFLVGNTTADKHRLKIGETLSQGTPIPASLLSEVHAGALLCNWGANVRFVPRQASPTPDIEASWDDGIILDVEVARGDMRQLHAAVQSGVQAFVSALRPGDVAWNVVGYIADASQSGDLTAMFEAATILRPDQCVEEAGRWCVRAVPLARRDDVVGAHTKELFAPSWWPSSEPNYFASSTLIGATGNPVVQLRSLVPLASYMNPLLRKASSGQGRTGSTYLIALDVSELPHAHERIVDDLSGYFKIWSHVSGVLLFEPRFWIGADRKEWVVSIHRNFSASVSLPVQLAAIAGRGRKSIGVALTQSQE